MKNEGQDSRTQAHVTPVSAIAGVVLGALSLFLPYFVAVLLVPAALVCALLALRSGAKKWGMAGLVLTVLGGIGVFTVSSKISSTLSGNYSESTSTSKQHRVTYVLKGTAERASVTMTNESGGTDQHVVRVPWTKEMSVPTGRFVYFSAQNRGEWGGLEAALYVDAVLIQESSASASYGIASVSGVVR